jgi:hypothetical protein
MRKLRARGNAPRRKLAERPTQELLAEVWTRWRRRTGQPVFRDFSAAAIGRLDEAQPAWRLYADLLDKQTIRPHDTTSVRLAILRALFIQGRHPTDVPMEDGEPPVAAAA